jgi:hypothetical protein
VIGAPGRTQKAREQGSRDTDKSEADAWGSLDGLARNHQPLESITVLADRLSVDVSQILWRANRQPIVAVFVFNDNAALFEAPQQLKGAERHAEAAVQHNEPGLRRPHGEILPRS